MNIYILTVIASHNLFKVIDYQYKVPFDEIINLCKEFSETLTSSNVLDGLFCQYLYPFNRSDARFTEKEFASAKTADFVLL